MGARARRCRRVFIAIMCKERKMWGAKQERWREVGGEAARVICTRRKRRRMKYLGGALRRKMASFTRFGLPSIEMGRVPSLALLTVMLTRA